MTFYTYDSKGRRDHIDREDGTYCSYDYNDRDEVLSGIKRFANDTLIPLFYQLIILGVSISPHLNNTLFSFFPESSVANPNPRPFLDDGQFFLPM